jgi:hypothetical protein
MAAKSRHTPCRRKKTSHSGGQLGTVFAQRTSRPKGREAADPNVRSAPIGARRTALVAIPVVNLTERTLVGRIAHPGVDLVNKDVPQVPTDRHDLVPCQGAITPVQKTLQPNAKIRRRHWHGISTSVAAGVVLPARFCLGLAEGWALAGAALVRRVSACL